jgi:hypothetical protein
VINGNDNAPYNLPSPVPTTPPMQGFVTDYIANFPLGDTTGGAGPTYQQYQPIMQCFPPTSVPVLATLAEQFAVFTTVPTPWAPCCWARNSSGRSTTRSRMLRAQAWQQLEQHPAHHHPRRARRLL